MYYRDLNMCDKLMRHALCIQPKLLNNNQKLVLIKLAHHCNKIGASCFPSLKAISIASELSKQTVISCLKILQLKGLISKHNAKRPNGSNTSNRYTLNTNLIEKLSTAEGG